MTPNRDDNKENEITDENIATRSRVRRLRPLPLCLSDNENKLPVLTIIPINEDHSNTNVSDDDKQTKMKAKLCILSSFRNVSMMMMNMMKITVIWVDQSNEQKLSMKQIKKTNGLLIVHR